MLPVCPFVHDTGGVHYAKSRRALQQHLKKHHQSDLVYDSGNDWAVSTSPDGTEQKQKVHYKPYLPEEGEESSAVSTDDDEQLLVSTQSEGMPTFGSAKPEWMQTLESTQSEGMQTLEPSEPEREPVFTQSVNIQPTSGSSHPTETSSVTSSDNISTLQHSVSGNATDGEEVTPEITADLDDSTGVTADDGYGILNVSVMSFLLCNAMLVWYMLWPCVCVYHRSEFC